MHLIQRNEDFGSSLGKWINSLRYINTMEHYSIMKRNKLLIYSTTWMNLNSIIMNNAPSQFQIVNYCIILFTLHSQSYKIIVNEISLVARSWVGRRILLLVVNKIQFLCGGRTMLYLDCGGAYESLYLW